MGHPDLLFVYDGGEPRNQKISIRNVDTLLEFSV